MSGDDLNEVLCEQQRESQIGGRFVRAYALLEELRFQRREAQAEANLAYEDWRRDPCRNRYAVYLAAQDRADAAQDQLAHCTQHLAV